MGEHGYKDTHADTQRIKLLVAGGFSGAVGKTLVSPLYRVTVRNMKTVGVPEYYKHGIIEAISGMFKKEGIKGLFKGNGTHLVKKVPFAAIKFFSYERYKQLLTPANKDDAGPMLRFISGGGAALTAITLTYPLDFVQTQLTVQTTNSKYTGIVNTLSTVIKEEGFLQLYRGYLATIMSSAPYIALNMSIWEQLKIIAKGYDDKKSHGPLISAACGATSGAIASTIVFPMDVLRRHIQLNRNEYSSYSDAIKKILLKDGIKGFYRGLIPHFLTVVPAASVSLASYDLAKLLLKIN